MVLARAMVWMLGGALGAALPADADEAPLGAIADLAPKAVVSAGDPARLQHALARARRGARVVVGVIGGSITQGARASTAEQRYGNRIAQWWRETFPQAQVEFVNAGIGATGSNYGALRARRDLLGKQPDVVVAEYAVNDGNTQAAAETLEGLVRQILAQPNQPAVLLLFTMNRQGNNAQEWHGRVGERYRLPMISFRDALWPEIQAGRLAWEDVEADEVHPNDRGHAAAAHFVNTFVAGVLADLPPDDRLPAIAPLPAPRFSDRFEHVTLLEADALQPVANQGWTYDAAKKGWVSDQPGSVVEFELAGTVILVSEWHVRGPMGKAEITVDGGAPVVVDAWFEPTWGGWRATRELARDLPSGPHRVRVELLAERHPQSDGHEFRILGLAAAGVR